MGSETMTGFTMPTTSHEHPTNHRRLVTGTIRRSGGTALSMKGFASALLISDRDALRASFSKVLNGVFSGF